MIFQGNYKLLILAILFIFLYGSLKNEIIYLCFYLNCHKKKMFSILKRILL